ncbi:uncharacterized protein METZ01_LOCUS430021 [marine metagenome]|uniref:LysM domain-containing protein n=1 Tax=marine metagenome TaxID=408172 RepID=A0A382Y1D5_9ZZZZ
MRSLIKFSAMFTAFCLSSFIVTAQENPPKPSTVPPQKNTPKKGGQKKPTSSTAGSENKYFLEQIRQLRGGLEELKGAYNLQIRKMMTLEQEMKTLRSANENLKRESALRFASNKDIDELAAKLMEMDKNRRNDLQITNKQIDEILKIVTKLATSPVPAVPPIRNNPPPAKFKAREHVVQPGEFLSTILEAYNSAFKAEGLSGRVTQSQVLKANPGMNADRLLVGQKLLIPLPGQIK